MKLKKALRPLKAKIKERSIYAFDIETYNNNRDFLCGSIYGDTGYKFFTDKESMIQDILTCRNYKDSYICATNLMFDFYSLFNIHESLEWFNILERQGSLVYAETYINDSSPRCFHPVREKGYNKITFIDSGNHLRSSVQNLGKIVSLPKMDAPIFLGQKPKDTEEWEYLKEYNIRDSMITYKFMKFCQSEYNKLGANLKMTVSSTALDKFRRSHLKYEIAQEPLSSLKRAYKSYYGGRTEVFKRGLFSSENGYNIKSYDVNSLYPYCLKSFEYPDVRSYRVFEKISTDMLERFEGVCYAELKSPYMDIPFLPMKQVKLLFPTGILKGYYDFATLRHAMNLGYDIIILRDAVVYFNKMHIFKEYVEELYNTRMELKKRGDSSEIIVKLLLNSFYGKFGYRFYNKERLVPSHLLDSYSKGYNIMPTRDESIFRVITTENSNIPSYCIPVFSVYTTAYSRILMHDKFKQIGYDNIYYTDTDCIFTTKRLETSNDIGCLKVEHDFKELILCRPKFYAGLEADKGIIKAKGVYNSMLDYNMFKDMLKNNYFKSDMTNFLKLRSAIGTNRYINMTSTVSKDINLNDDKRYWENIFNMEPQDSTPIDLNK